MVNKFFVLGAVAIFLGVAGVVIGPFSFKIVGGIESKEIKKTVLVDSFTSSGYASWQSNAAPTEPSKLLSFYMFNITNPTDVGSGSAPIVKEIGPFVYKEIDQRIDVVFSSDKTQASYKYFTQYHYQPSLSTSTTDDMEITTVNIAYLAILNEASSEADLQIGVFADFLNTTINELVTDFVEDTLLVDLVPVTIDEWFFVLKHNLSNWVSAASTTPAWTLTTDISALLPLALAAELLDDSVPYSLAYPSQWQLWLSALEDPTAAKFLQNWWGISATVQGVLSYWLYSVWVGQMVPLIAPALYNVETVTELAYLQWATLDATGEAGHPGPSLHTLDPDSTPFFIEYAAWATYVADGEAANLTVAQAATVFTQFINDDQWAVFLLYVSIEEWAHIESTWGLTEAQALSLVEYSQYVVGQVIGGLIAGNSGLFKTDTVHNLIFGYTDELLDSIAPGSAAISTKVNYTTVEDTQANQTVEARYTGFDDISKIGWYSEFDGLPDVPYWATPEYFAGGDASETKPGYNVKAAYTIFETNTQRNLDFQWTDGSSVHGIKTNHYILPTAQFESETVDPTNAKYFTKFTGFHNLTTIPLNGQTGIPLYISLPHFLGANTTWANKVSLLNADGTVTTGLAPDAAKHTSTLDIEPLSGQTLDAHACLQLNVLLDPAEFGIYFSSPPNAFVPLYWVSEDVEMTPDQAKAFKKEVGVATTAETALIAIFVPLGVLNLVLGALFIRKGRSASVPKAKTITMAERTDSSSTTF